MADAVPTEGSWYALKADYGDSHGAIPKDALCQVTHIFPAGTQGVGILDAEVVVVRHLERSAITNRICQRRFTLRKDDFASMFVEGTEPKKHRKEWDDAQKQRSGS